MRAHHRRLAAATTLGVATLLLLSACGGGTSDSGTPAHPSGTSVVTSSSPSSSASPSRSPSSSETSVEETSAADPTPASSAVPTSDTTAVPAVSAGGSACSLVTRANVATILEGDPGPGAPFTSHGASQCQYGEYQTAFVLVNVLPTRGNAAYDHAHDNPKLGQAGTIADVPGVGDRAFSIASPMTASIYFTVGDALVLVMVEIYGAAASPMDQARALATVAAGRV